MRIIPVGLGYWIHRLEISIESRFIDLTELDDLLLLLYELRTIFEFYETINLQKIKDLER